MHAFTLYLLSPTLTNHKHTHNHVISLVTYAPTLHHATPLHGQSLLYNMSHTAVSFSFIRSLQRPSWPKRPAIIVIDSATYLLTISSANINKVAMSLYDIIRIYIRKLKYSTSSQVLINVPAQFTPLQLMWMHTVTILFCTYLYSNCSSLYNITYICI